MSTSGSYSFTYDYGEMISEAAERAGLDPASLEARHLVSMRRSLNLILAELDNYVSDAEYRLDRVETDLVSGRRAVLLPEGTIDVLDAQIRDADNNYWDLARTTRQSYLRLEMQEVDGETVVPSHYWVTRESPADPAFLDSTQATLEAGISSYQSFDNVAGDSTTTATTAGIYMVLWPALIGDNYTLVFYRMRQTQAMTAMAQDIDAPRLWWDAITHALASRTAQKFNPSRYADLRAEAIAMIDQAKDNSYPRGDVVIAFRGFGFSRTRRH